MHEQVQRRTAQQLGVRAEEASQLPWPWAVRDFEKVSDTVECK